MAFGSVQLVPGVNVERTPMLLRAGYSASSLGRWRDGLFQKYGGWQRYYPFNVPGVPRDLHAWQDLNDVDHLAVGTTGSGTELAVITNNQLSIITPQQLTSNFAPNISTTINSPIVAITDPNISNVTVLDSVFFAVPVSVGGLVLDGLYPITEITGTNSYQITAPTNATFTQTNPTATNAATASGNTLHFSAVPSWVAEFMSVGDITTPGAIPAGTYVTAVGATTVTLSNNVAGGGVGNGDDIVFCSLPLFTTTNGSPEVNVNLFTHGITETGPGTTVVFPVATTVGGLNIQGSYTVTGIPDANDFDINSTTQATSSATAPMNNGQMQLVYYITIGPPPAGSGFGLGGFGLGGFGTGAAAGSTQTGTPITATDWTTDNWGEILIACPQGGALYYFDPTGGNTNASIISGVGVPADGIPPIFNTGVFVSTTEQILIAYGSSVHEAIGYQYDPLLVQWSDVANFFQWDPEASDQAGNFHIPIGSRLVGGMAAANQNLLWTDLDLWLMTYIGPPDVFGFNQVGAGMGLVSGHAAQKLRGGVYWMSPTNFCSYTGNGAAVIPCPVWDVVFQNLNTNFLANVRAMPNTPFNEAGWEFPSLASVNGENDSFVKFNITEPGAPWDYSIGGVLPRSAWIDQSVLGMPIGAAPNGAIYLHETTPDAAGSALVASFTTGLFYLKEGEEFVVVDQVIPDFKWSTFGGSGSAQVQISFNMYNYPTDTPTTYGPYIVTSATEFISTRMRGRLMSITVQSSDVGSFWRLGSIKYRYTTGGRR